MINRPRKGLSRVRYLLPGATQQRSDAMLDCNSLSRIGYSLRGAIVGVSIGLPALLRAVAPIA
jgi:hypothetical protein